MVRAAKKKFLEAGDDDRTRGWHEFIQVQRPIMAYRASRCGNGSHNLQRVELRNWANRKKNGPAVIVAVQKRHGWDDGKVHEQHLGAAIQKGPARGGGRSAIIRTSGHAEAEGRRREPPFQPSFTAGAGAMREVR